MKTKNNINRPSLIINGKRETPEDNYERKTLNNTKKIDLIVIDYSKIPESQHGDLFVNKNNLDVVVENMIGSLEFRLYDKNEIRSIVKDYLNSNKNYK